MQKLDAKTRYQIEEVLLRLYANKLEVLNIKQLKGGRDLYRLRVGRYIAIPKQNVSNMLR